MEIIVIGKPAINVYLPLQEFPLEGDVFTIKAKNESVGNVGATSACLLGKWGVKTHIAGVIGKDSYADKIHGVFDECNVDSRHLEVNINNGTSINYIILNAKNGVPTKVIYNDPKVELTKYKYEFSPDYAILDGTDHSGSLALLNSAAECKTIYYARSATKENIQFSKRCNYVVCTESFASELVKFDAMDNAEGYVNLYQKMVDIGGHSNYIVLLNNHKVLYSVDGKVKMLPEMKMNAADYSSYDSVFVGAFTYGLINNLNIDEAIKFANTASAISISRIGEVPAIPTLDEVLDNSGFRDKLGGTQDSGSKEIAPQAITPLTPSPQPVNNVEMPMPQMNQTPIAQAMPEPVQQPIPQAMPEQVVNQEVQAQAFNQAPMMSPQEGNNV